MAGKPTRAIEIFFSYAHEDEMLRNELEKHLSNLKQQDLITGWHDRNISAGTEWAYEIDTHLNTAQIILLLISPDFMASHYYYSIEMKRAMERYEAGEARVIPIILRATDWEGALFDKLQVLPTDGRPVKGRRNREKAFVDIAQGIRKAVEELSSTKDEQIAALRQQYCNALYEQWKMLDFKGIMHIEMNRPLSIPLTEVFVFSDVQVGVPQYETLEREDERENKESSQKKAERRGEDEQEQIPHRDRQARRPRKEKSIRLQREALQTVLAKNRRLVILGDPGAGKSTLLRYLLLQLARGSNTFMGAFPQLADAASAVPVYMPLASYAEFWRSSKLGERSLKDFLPGYLQENYLVAYVNFIQQQLERGSVFFLLDGLDEIPDVTLRIEIVRQIEGFTRSYPKNRFIVTSRIVGYKEAQLAVDYQPYTLADFNENQIKTFTQKWCPAYERWVKGTTESQHLQYAATKEAEKLFQATQRNPGVKRLAISPLLLTILALIQRQGIELPSHRVELYDLCATTLIETWVKAKGRATHFSKNDLVKILRPLAFWMHAQSEVGAIHEEELTEQIVKQLLERKITRDEREATKLAEQFLETVRGQTGILVERGKQRYGFLHQTFEEYFAARELVIRKDKERNDFIKQHLHEAHWREVILLAVGIIGILDSDEEGVTELVQGVILQAGSHFEKWLHRDLLFAGLCLVDDVGIGIECEDNIIEQIVELYINTSHASLRNAISSMLTSLNGTQAATKLTSLVLSMLRKRKPVKDDQRSIQQYRDQQNSLICHYIRIALDRLKIDMEDQMEKVPVRLTRSARRGEAEHAPGYLDRVKPKTIATISKALSDRNPQMREAIVRDLGQPGQGQPEVIVALLKTLSDPDFEVRWKALAALGKLGQDQPEVIVALLKTLSDSAFEVWWTAICVLEQLGQDQPEVIVALLKALSNTDSGVRVAAAIILGQFGQDQPEVIDILLKVFSNSNFSYRVRWAAAYGLMQVGSEHPQINDTFHRFRTDSFSHSWIKSLARHALDKTLTNPFSNFLETLLAVFGLGRMRSEQPQAHETRHYSDRNLGRKEAVAYAQVDSAQQHTIDVLLAGLLSSDTKKIQSTIDVLVKMGTGQPHIIRYLLDFLSNPSSFSFLQQRIDETKRKLDRASTVRQSGLLIDLLKQVGSGQPQVIDVLINALFDSDIRWAAADALVQIGQEQPQVIDALLRNLSDSNPDVSGAVVNILGELGRGQPQVIDSLLKALSNFDVGRPTADESRQFDQRQSQLIDALFQVFPDPAIGWIIVRALRQFDQGEPHVIDTLLKALSDADSDVRRVAVRALSQLGQGQSEVIDALLKTLSDRNSDVREASTQALGQLGHGRLQVIDALLEILSEHNSNIRRVAIHTLEQLGQGQPQVLKALLKALSDADTNVKEAAAQALGQLGQGQPQVLKALLKALSDADTNVKEAAVQALGQLGQGQPQVLKALLKALSDADTNVKEAVAQALGQLGQGQPQVLKALLKALSDADTNVKEAAVQALGQLGQGQPQVLKALLKALSDADTNVKEAAAQALGQLGQGQPQVLKALLKALSDRSPDVIRAAAGTLAILQVDRLRIGQHIEELLLEHEPITSRQFETDDTIDALLFALQQVVEEV